MITNSFFELKDNKETDFFFKRIPSIRSKIHRFSENESQRKRELFEAANEEEEEEEEEEENVHYYLSHIYDEITHQMNVV